jgi:hypothetical protein
MKVRFLTDYQGQHTGPHFYLAGQVADVVESAALRLIADHRAELVEDAADYETMSMAELREIAMRVGADTARSKVEMIHNIREMTK